MGNDALRGELLIEMMKAQKDEMKLTNAVIAEMSGVPESTVTKVFNGTNRSPSYDTIAPIARVLGVSLDGGAGDSSSVTSSGKELGLYVALLCYAYEEQARKKERWIIFLTALLVMILALMIGLTVYDYTHPDVGWVRYVVME